MLLIPLLYLSSLGWVLERDQVGSSSMVRSIPSAIFPYLGAIHKRNLVEMYEAQKEAQRILAASSE